MSAPLGSEENRTAELAAESGWSACPRGFEAGLVDFSTASFTPGSALGCSTGEEAVESLLGDLVVRGPMYADVSTV